MSFNFTDDQCEAAPVVKKSMANCTIISLLPYPVRETKPNIYPGYFQIPSAKETGVAVLPIGESVHAIESAYKGQPNIRVVESPKVIAAAIVHDFLESQLAIEPDAQPGFFFVEGHYTVEEAKKTFPARIKEAEEFQKNWFVVLVRIADDDWEKTHQHKFISDIQRYAAKYLNLNREWIQVTVDNAMDVCPLCKELVRQDAIVHSICGYILKPKEYETMKANIVKS